MSGPPNPQPKARQALDCDAERLLLRGKNLETGDVGHREPLGEGWRENMEAGKRDRGSHSQMKALKIVGNYDSRSFARTNMISFWCNSSIEGRMEKCYRADLHLNRFEFLECNISILDIPFHQFRFSLIPD
jgi:hypothetical protein